MKLNKRLNWYIAGVLALALATFWLLKPRNQPESASHASLSSSDNSRNASQSANTPAPTGSGTTPFVDPVYEAVKAEREKKLHEIANTPIEFFGKVVDERGNPVEGASTFYIVGTLSFDGSPTLEGPRTDGSGLFSITGKRGPNLSVRVEHDGYHMTGTAKQRFEYARKDYTPGNEPPPPPRESSAPAVFVLKRKGVAEPLMHHQRIKTKLPMNDSPVTIDARSGRAGVGGNETISISMKSDGDKLPLNEFHPFDWSVTIEAPGGGILERTDAIDFEAPEDGYVPHQTINMPASLPRDAWKSDIQRDYFIKFASGNYGRIRLNISGDKGRSIAEVFLNPTPGSRNLEFDPARAVKSP